jgi:hypothetical protein
MPVVQIAYEVISELVDADGRSDMIEDFITRPDDVLCQIAAFRSYEQLSEANTPAYSESDLSAEIDDLPNEYFMSGALPPSAGTSLDTDARFGEAGGDYIGGDDFVRDKRSKCGYGYDNE